MATSGKRRQPFFYTTVVGRPVAQLTADRACKQTFHATKSEASMEDTWLFLVGPLTSPLRACIFPNPSFNPTDLKHHIYLFLIQF